MKPILRKGTRILRPDEYNILRKKIKKHQKHRLDGLLLTGMRYIEAKRFQNNPDWLHHNGFIEMPPGASLKEEMQYKERTIRLSNLGEELVPLFLETKPLPSRQAWRENLRRWADYADLDPAGLSAKTTRKTWESWLVHCFPDHLTHIFQSQGHTEKTAVEHYISLPFGSEDRKKMKKWVQGWIET